MLLCCLRRTLKPSASATVISKLYRHFRDRGLPYGLQDSLPTLSLSRSISLIIRWGEAIRDLLGFFSESQLVSNRYMIIDVQHLQSKCISSTDPRFDTGGWLTLTKTITGFLPTGTYTLQDTPSFARRDNDKFSGNQSRSR